MNKTLLLSVLTTAALYAALAHADTAGASASDPRLAAWNARAGTPTGADPAMPALPYVTDGNCP